jgi:hypothetical protein
LAVDLHLLPARHYFVVLLLGHDVAYDAVAVVLVVVLRPVVYTLAKRVVVRDRHWVLPVVMSVRILMLN